MNKRICSNFPGDEADSFSTIAPRWFRRKRIRIQLINSQDGGTMDVAGDQSGQLIGEEITISNNNRFI